jgi:hypothetical protein
MFVNTNRYNGKCNQNRPIGGDLPKKDKQRQQEK